MAKAKAKVAAAPVAEKPKAVRITADMLAELAGPQQTPDHPPRPIVPNHRAVFAAPKPPAGVVPNDMAFDDCGLPSGVLQYASQGAYASGLGIGFPGYGYLSELAQIVEYRRGSEILANEMTRKWLTLRGSGDEDKTEKVKVLTQELERFGVRDLFRRAAEHDGLFGIGHIYIDTGATDDQDELRTGLWLDKAKIAQGSLKGFRTVEPVWTYPNQYNSNDPLAPDFYLPQTWFVMGKEVHRSRLLQFVARPVPDLLKPAYMFGGVSLSQLGEPSVRNWLETRCSVNRLIQSFSTPVLATTLDTLIQPGSMALLINRLMLFNQTRNNRGAFAINKETEEFSNVSTPLSTLDMLQAQAQEHMAACWKIPTMVLLGLDPAGLNATGDGQIRTFYDWAGSQQRNLFDANFRRVLNIIQLNKYGEIDPEITHEWEPLWKLDAAGMAAIQKTKADTYAVLANDCNAISNEEIRTAVAADIDSPFHGLKGDAPEPPDLDDTDLAEQEPTSGGEAPGESKAAEKSGV